VNDDIHDPDAYLPGDDVTDDSMEACRERSKSCGLCGGSGWATIFHMNYTGEQVVNAWDGYREKPKVMRSVAYCTCAAGRKMMFIHQEKSKDVFKRLVDANDIASGRHPEWGFDDPATLEAMTVTQESQLPHRLQQALARYRRP
jgi:hypothetical protein